MSQPETVKVFASHNEDYTAAFELFLQHTDQKRQALAWLLKQVQDLPRRDFFVDAGAGNGLLTAQLAPHFQRTLAIEPNPSLAEELRVNCPAVEFRPTTIPDAGDISGADFVLCSHVFYYIPQAEWEATLERLASWVRPEGVVVLALQNPQTDCMRMTAEFTGAGFDLSGLARSFARTAGSRYEVELARVPATIQTASFDTAYRIAEFVLNVIPWPRPLLRQDLEEHVRTRFAQPDGRFRFSCDQDFLRLRRLQ